MRIALATEGTRGDIHPMLALGEIYRSQGHQVVLCAPPNFETDAHQRGLEFQGVGEDTLEYLVAQAGAIAGGGLRQIRACLAYLRESLREQLVRTPEITRDVDCIFAAGLQIGARFAAELHGIPYRYIAYCPAIIPAADVTPALLPAQNLPRWANRLAWRASLLFFDLTLCRRLNEHRAAHGLAPVFRVIEHVLGERPVLAADEELAPASNSGWWASEQIPCLHPLAGPPLPEKLDAFLTQGPPPVYFGFGSMTDPDPGNTTGKLLDVVAALGTRAVISKGWAGLADGPLPEGVFATGPVTHARLFRRCAAVVHHGGAGTTTTAARAGVPQILVPHLLDQFYWSHRVSELGLGPPHVRRSRLSVDRLAELLAVTLENEVLSDRAREIGERLRVHAATTREAALALLPS